MIQFAKAKDCRDTVATIEMFYLVVLGACQLWTDLGV
jgi:hypothetical protein